MNIWTDRAAATNLRRLAGGNETVPTVVVGDTSLVNPSAAEVLAIAGGLPEAALLRPASPPGFGLRAVQVAQWVVVVALVVASIAVDRYGHAGVSWILDAAALAAYLVARVLRRRVERHGAP